jgi:hypothetical protein
MKWHLKVVPRNVSFFLSESLYTNHISFLPRDVSSCFNIHMYLSSLQPRHRSQSVSFLQPYAPSVEGTGFLYGSTVRIAVQFSLSQCRSSIQIALALQFYSPNIIHTQHCPHEQVRSAPLQFSDKQAQGGGVWLGGLASL